QNENQETQSLLRACSHLPYVSFVSSKEHVARLAGAYSPLLKNNDGPPNYSKILSKREYQVFLLLAEGIRPKDIAEQSGLDPRTVSSYIRRIREKLNVKGLGQIIKLAMEHEAG
ncbi:MAG: LuxR family transcriptional regulator, partial [Desulfovibrionales bacterium]